jgi:hypothetical protein
MTLTSEIVKPKAAESNIPEKRLSLILDYFFFLSNGFISKSFNDEIEF